MFESDLENIFNFLIHETSAQEFEKWLYSEKELELRIGSESFIDIVSLNYKNKYVSNDLEKILFEEKIDIKEFNSWKLRKTLRKTLIDYGWFEGRTIKVENHKLDNSKAVKNAIEIISEFGGLKIEETGKGINSASGDISFFLIPISDNLINKIPNSGGLICFASAHNQHMGLYVDGNRKYYVYTDPDSQLYEFLIDSLEELIGDVIYGRGFDNFKKVNIR